MVENLYALSPAVSLCSLAAPLSALSIAARVALLSASPSFAIAHFCASSGETPVLGSSTETQR